MAETGDESSDEEHQINIFEDPKDYYAPEKPSTSTAYTCVDGTVINLRLVGHSPLWGHLLWNAARTIVAYLEVNATHLVEGKTVLELGAGAGLPSLICAKLKASKVVVTDYPEPELIQNLQHNIESCDAVLDKSVIVAEGFLWGNSVIPLKSHLPPNDNGFDLLILADILFNHSEHEKLVRTVKDTLKSDGCARALVFFTPYRPWLLANDLNFFKLAEDADLEVKKVVEHTMDKVMFEKDPGDELLRRTVYGYEVQKRSS